MKQNPFKRLISLLVVFAMLCTMVPTAFAVTPSQFEDFPQGWSKEAMTFAVNNGIINGKSETAIEPESNLTRAEMAAIINRAFGAVVADDISEYTDVSKDEWYYNDIGVAVHMETFHGDGDGKMRPDDFITREEVMAVLARALVLEYEDFSPITKFGDYSSVSQWARPTLAALIGEGYVDGYEDKTLRPLNNITREEFVQLMYNIFKTYLSTENESYKKVDSSDCVMINRPGITLSNVTIEGDLVLGDGVGSGKVYLNNVTIKGRLLARGGFITLKKVTTGKGVVVKNVNGRTHFYNYKKESVFDGVRELTYTTYLTTTGGGSSGGGGGGGGSSTKYEYTVNYYFQSAGNLSEYVLDESRTVKNKATSGTSVKAEIPDVANYVYNKDKSTEQITITSGTNELKVYYDLVKYGVSYTNPDGTTGTADVAHGQEIGDVVNMPGTYTDPDNNTYDVDWIYTDKDGNKKPVTPDTPITGEGTLTPVLYAKIVFDYNYPESTPSEVKAEKGKKIADLLPQNPVRDGYTFEGWNTKPDGSGDSFDADTVVNSPATIYAVWKPVSVAPDYYTVTFVYNYENAPSEYFEKYENVLEGSKILKPETNPVRAGYNFEGWYKNAEGTVEFVFENENITADTVIYAKWKEKAIVPTVHTVTFNLNGGSGNILPVSVSDGNKISRPAQDPVLIGFEFAGWYTEPECINEYNFNTPVTSSFTLYAKWVEVKPDTYTVSFNTFGGTVINPVTVTAGSTVTKPSNPVKDGYTFGGWYTDMNCTVAYDFSKAVNSSFTLYAKWNKVEVNKYTVEFITDSSDVIAPQIVEEGKKAVKPADPSKTGYSFGGWYTDTAYTTEYNFNTPVTADVTLYAKWIANIYDVVFETNGGSYVGSQQVEYGSKAVKPEDPSKDGFNFMGWYTDASFKNYYDFDTAVTSNLTLYAKWEEIIVLSYVVTFETYGGTTLIGTPIKPQTVAAGELMDRPADPVKPGHDFVGWYTDETFTTKFDFKTPVNSNLTVYAKYNVHTFEISFESNGGSDVESQIIEYDKTVTEPEAPEREGYTFIGWYSDYDLYEPYDFTTPVKEEFTLYAKWEVIVPNEYTVVFVNEGSTTIPAQRIIEGNKVTKPSTPRRTGYTFGGWYTDEQYQNVYDFNTPVYSSFTLYAKWNINIYDVVFVSNGGSPVTTQNIPYNTSAVEPEAPTKDGYVFAGWYTNKACTLLYDFSTPVIKDITLYAKWTARVPNQYYVTFRSNGGTTVGSQRVKEGNKATEPAAPTKTGYTFDGWYSDSALTVKYDFDTVVNADITLYAKWNINKYVVSFITNCDAKVDSQTVDYMSTATEPVAPENYGYTFKGWYTDSGFVSKYNFATPVKGDTTLYAKWELNKYEIEFNTDGGTQLDNQTIDHGSKLTKPSDPEKTGYTFGGWYTDSAYNNAYDFESEVVSGLVLYAKWIINKYTVEFDSGYDIAVDSQIVEYGSKVTEPQALVREGYDFNGWYTNSSYTNLYDFDKAVESDLKLYAKWTIKKFTIAFDMQDGQTTSQTVNYGSTLTKPADPEKEGYTFAGWYTDSECTKEYDFGSSVTGEFTLYAKWNVNKYTVSFDSKGGTTISSQTVNHGTTVTEPEAPEKEGFTFGGWYTDSECTVKYDFTAPVKNSFTLYAKWTVKKFTIAFDMQDGQTTSQTVNYGSTLTKPADPEKEGYTFAGWYTDSECTKEYDFGSSVTGEFTLYAKWNVNEYTVSFDSKGGTTISSQTVNHGTSVTEPEAPEKEGFTFGGWYTDSECTVKYDFASPVKNSFTLYAKWTVKEFTITFDMQDGQTTSQTVNYGSTLTEPADPEKEGYTFAGWYTDSECTKEYDFGSSVTGEFTLYAKWNVNEYTVSFDSKGGTTISSQTVNHGTAVTEPEAPEKEGFTFGGWYTDSECTVKYDFASPVKNSFTLYAKWISVTEKFKVDFYYGVNESVSHIGTVKDIASGSTVAEATYVKVFEDEGIFFEDEGMAGYRDGSYTHMIYPELRYLDENGKWQIFDETVKVVSNMKVYYTFKYIQLMLDGSFLGINLNNVSLNTHYASDTRFMDSLKDAMYLSRNPINNGLKGKDAEIIKKLSENTGFIDLDGYVEIKPFGLHISELIDNEDIHKEVVSYIEECLHGPEDVVRYIVGMTEVQDIIECIGAENISDTSTDGIVEYLLEHRYDNSESYAKIVAKIADVIETYGYFGEFMSSFYDKKADYEINKNTVKLAKAVAEAVYEFSDTEVIRLLRNKGFGVVVDLYGEEEFKNMFAQSQKEYYDEVFAVANSVMNGEKETARYSTSLTVRVNIAELLGSVSAKINKKLVGRLSGNNTNDYYTKNPYLKEFVEQDIMDVLFTFNPSAVSTTNSGYKVKPVIEYYDIALENLILIDKALLWYGNLTEEERDEMREQYAVELVTLFSDINDIFAATQNGGSVVAGYTLDELIRLTDKASSLIDKIGEDSFGGLEKDIKLMMGDVKYYLEKLGSDGKLPTGLTVAELTAINNKLASASEAYGKKDFALANDLYAEAIAQILNHVSDVVREAKASGTVDGESLEEKLSHIPFVNKFSSKIIDMIVDMADNGFAKEYTKDIILETFDVERIESIIIGHDIDDRFTIDTVVDFIVPYIEDNKVESPEHSADEIVIDQYEKVANEESVTLRRYLY